MKIFFTKRDFKVFARWIREERKKRNISSQELAQIMSWLRQKNPRFNHIKFITAVYLGE